MKQLTRLEDEPSFGAIFLQLIKSAFLNSLQSTSPVDNPVVSSPIVFDRRLFAANSSVFKQALIRIRPTRPTDFIP